MRLLLPRTRFAVCLRWFGPPAQRTRGQVKNVFKVALFKMFYFFWNVECQKGLRLAQSKPAPPAFSNVEGSSCAISEKRRAMCREIGESHLYTPHSLLCRFILIIHLRRLPLAMCLCVERSIFRHKFTYVTLKET